MDTTNYIAVNEQLATAGAIIWWRITAPTELAALTEMWATEGFDPDLLPKAPTKETALYRACYEQKAQRTLVRPLKGKGWAIVSESAEPDRISHATRATVFLSQEGIITLNGDNSLLEQITTDFEHHMCNLSKSDMSKWLVKQLYRLEAVSLRSDGGVYFIPQPSLEEWNSICRVLASLPGSNVLTFSVPAMHSEDAVHAILDAVEREAATLCEGIVADVEQAENRASPRVLRNREKALLEIDAKVTRYENLLGKKSESFRELLEKVSASVTAALMAAETTSAD